METDFTKTPRQLIVVAKRDAGLRVRRESIASISEFNVAPLEARLSSLDIILEPLFGVSENRLRTESLAMARGTEIPEFLDMSLYYTVKASDEKMEEIALSLSQEESIETAYVKPPSELPLAPEETAEEINEMLPTSEDAPPATPNFTSRQIYLGPASAGGIDAHYAWTKSGGTGSGVNIIDLEWGWRFTHEDLTQNQGGVVSGTGISNDNHGTAVIGEIGGDRNSVGITGICPDAIVSAVSFATMDTSVAIRQAANRLRPGDIMLLEVHRAGPRHTFQGRLDQRGYVAIEWWPEDYLAIRNATSKGIIVVEAAGNGRENLDDKIYDINPAPPYGPFPFWWKNPYRRKPLDSGAIIVGAGAPPPGTHGRNHGPDRSRLDFSNYGALVDAQGWGREVTSTGYGDLQNGTDRDYWYTDRFSGTSSASPIIVGALGCVQGFRRAKNQVLLTPTSARKELRETGSPQQDAPGMPSTQRIGNRPNLRELIKDCFVATAAYGTNMDPNVELLRDFRDEVLLESKYKAPFEVLLELYYRFSPPIAYKMQENTNLKNTIKQLLDLPISILKTLTSNSN